MINNKRIADQSTSNVSQQKSNVKRVSLATIFSGVFFSLVVILVVVNIIISSRLSDFQSILSKLTVDVLPKVTISGQTFDQISQLTYLTARLSSSPSQAFRLIAYRDVKNKIEQIESLELVSNIDSALINQLESIISELSGLNRLIEKRINIQIQIKFQAEKMYQLHSDVMSISINQFLANQALKTNEQIYYAWIVGFTEIVTLSSKALATNRLNEVRQISNSIKDKFKTLNRNSNSLNFESKQNTLDLVNQLENVLVNFDGMLPTKINELRSIGQAIGRSNFVHNLVVDFSRQVQFQSQNLNATVLENAEETTELIEKESNFIKLMAVLSILFLVVATYFLHQKIIKRLVRLNYRVLNRISGGSLNLNLKGNDEISDIAQSFNLLIEEIEEQKQSLHELSLTDGLTGIANRRSLDEHLSSVINIATKNNSHLSFLMMDIDCFKNFNDHYGHLAGDDCLKDIVNAFRNSPLRKKDFVARFGGEEFVIILPDTNSEGAEKIAKAMLKIVSSLKITHEWNSASPYVTMSIGGASFDPQNPISDEALLNQADQALYSAKEQGKNCFVMFNDS
ncbi:MAG: hypothetical protein COA86_11300 [Kangiella sp.]|nr:MAG: hypothetical protein COA86_11300 [Kangiella sp.]